MNKKSVWVIVAGVIFIIVVTTLVDIALHLAGVYPSLGQPLDDTLAVLATSYRIVIGIAGAYLTARLAPGQPMKHSMIVGVVGTLLGIAGTPRRGIRAWAPICIPLLWLCSRYRSAGQADASTGCWRATGRGVVPTMPDTSLKARPRCASTRF